jgi:hypothetical protein
MLDVLCIGIAASLPILAGQVNRYHPKCPSAGLSRDDLDRAYAALLQRPQRIELQLHEFRSEQDMRAERRKALCLNLLPKRDLRRQTLTSAVLE